MNVPMTALQKIKENPNYVNAYEAWSLYDTVNIGIGQRDYNAKWFNNFVQLSQETSIPFFNQRNRSGVGVAYNSFDSAEQVSFAFKCYSIGLEWYAPFSSEVTYDEQVLAESDNPNQQLWFEMLRHASVRFQVGQDEKVLLNALGAPGGGGTAGIIANGVNAGIATYQYAYQTFSNGVAKLENRWAFEEPIEIPRSRNVAAWLTFSTYAKSLLARMAGPDYILTSTAELAEGGGLVPACYQMRLSLFGMREVQQRNELHF